MMRNVENNSVRVLHLPLEITSTFVTEIEKEHAASFFDALLRFFQVIDLEAKMVRANGIGGIRKIISLLAREFQKRQIHDAIAQIQRRADRQIFTAMPFETENFFVELSGFFQIADADCKMP